MHTLGKIILIAASWLLLGGPVVAQPRDSLIALAEEADFEEAVELYEKVTVDEEGRLIVDSLTGLALHRLGNLHFGKSDTTAAYYYRWAIPVRDSVFSEPHNDRAHSRRNLAVWLKRRNRIEESDICIREALNVYQEVDQPDTLNWLGSLYSLASSALKRQDLTLALSASYRTVKLRDEYVNVSMEDDFATSYQRALILLRLQLAEEAIPHAYRAVALAKILGDVEDIADSYNLLGIVQGELDQIEASYQSLRQGVMQIENSKEYARPQAALYLNLAEYYGKKGKLDRMLDYNSRARKLALQTENPDIYYTSDRTPMILYDSGRYLQALSATDERLDYLSGGRSDQLVDVITGDSLGFIIPAIDLLGVRAGILTALDRTYEAFNDYQRLFVLLDLLRGEVSTDASRHYLSKNLRPFIDRVVALHYQKYKEEGDTAHLWSALEMSEKGRAYTLMIGLNGGQSRITQNEARITARIAELERQVALGHTEQRDELAQSRLDLERIRRGRESIERFRAVDHEDIRELVTKQNCELLEYHLSETVNLAFHLRPTGELSVYSIPEADRLTARITDWRSAIEEGSYRRKSLRATAEQDSLDAAFLEGGLRLARQLLPPTLLVNTINHPRPRLCIVPDASLNYLPFSALPLTEDIRRPIDYTKLSYLREHAILHYAYSAAHLQATGSKQMREYQENLLAFAPSFGDTLSPLPYNREEVEAVKELVDGGTAYYGERATRNRFETSVGEQRILHLSSHASVDSDEPALSYIAFAPKVDSLGEQFLYFNELSRLPLDNELTVLSACETSLGKLAVGETTQSLASAFAAAGARSTLTTLWRVDDQATMDAIVAFYRELVAGADRATALHRAQRQLIDAEYAHPYYWAGLSLHGLAGPLAIEKLGGELLRWWGWLIALGLSAALFGYLLNFLHANKPSGL